jgi:hypothetical protein
VNSTEISEIFGSRCYEAKEGPGMRLLDPTVFVLGETAHMRLDAGSAASLADFCESQKFGSLRKPELVSCKISIDK